MKVGQENRMKCIIVIKGVSLQDYLNIRQDLTNQIKEREWEVPLFCHLYAADYADIEVVWLDEEMEKAMFSESLEKVIANESRPNL